MYAFPQMKLQALVFDDFLSMKCLAFYHKLMSINFEVRDMD